MKKKNEADVYQAVLELKRRAVPLDPAPAAPEPEEDPEITDNLDKLLGL